MKIFCFFSLLLIISSFNSHCQNPKELSPGYYVVVASFSPGKENYAQRFTVNLNKKGFSSAYGFNTKRNYYYVYLSRFPDLENSVKEMLATRQKPEYYDAWVRIVTDKLEMVDATAAQVVSVRALSEIPEEKEKSSGSVTVASKRETEDLATSSQALPHEKVTIEAPKQDAQTADQIKAAVTREESYDEIKDNPEIVQHEKITLGNTEVFLSLFNARNNRAVEGMVKVIDTEKSKLIREVKGNDYLYLPEPKNKTKQISLICEAFGYRKIQHELNHATPLADTVKDYVDLLGTTLIIYFDLIRYQVGDKGTLYNVYFYNDAAVMLPESKFELTSLLEMMRENPDYRVRLHGHTNGNYHGKIISAGPDKNFFSMEGSKSSIGSAKDLSRERADVIKEYLMSHEIEGSRIEVKAWGGKKPVYDRNGSNAKKNVRVEVEILND